MQFMKRNYKILLAVLRFRLPYGVSFQEKPKLIQKKTGYCLNCLLLWLKKDTMILPNWRHLFQRGLQRLHQGARSFKTFYASRCRWFCQIRNFAWRSNQQQRPFFFDLTYNRLQERIAESKSYYKEILAKPFDYKQNEELNTDYEHLPYAKNVAELKERWYKQIKLSTLSSLTNKLEIQEGKKSPIMKKILLEQANRRLLLNWKRSKKKRKSSWEKTIWRSWKETRESQLKSLDEYFGFIKDLGRDDWFSVYINAIASRFDPHTSYFAPDDKERFDMSISGKLEGIGARLQKRMILQKSQN